MPFFQSRYVKTIKEAENLLTEIKKQGIKNYIDLQKNKPLEKQARHFVEDIKKALKEIYKEILSETGKLKGYEKGHVASLTIQASNLINLRNEFNMYKLF